MKFKTFDIESRKLIHQSRTSGISLAHDGETYILIGDCMSFIKYSDLTKNNKPKGFYESEASELIKAFDEFEFSNIPSESQVSIIIKKIALSRYFNA